MKIGMVIDDSIDRNDGVQQYVRSLGKWLNKEGHTVHYLSGQTKAPAPNVYSLSRNINVRFNGNRLTIPLPANATGIKELLGRESYDVLHVQMPFSPMMSGKIIAHASEQTAVIGTFHILPFGKMQRYGSKALAVVQKRQLKRFDAICSVSPAAQAFAKAQFGVTSKVIPNLIDTAAWRNKISPISNRLVFLGRLVPRKGCMQFLKAFIGLPGDIKDGLEVIIAGDGPDKLNLEKFTKTNGLNNVRFLGFIEEKNKTKLLASANLAVFPSIGGESFGIVLIEAMSAGAGVVMGGNNPGYNSVLSDWPQTLVEPNDTKAFTASLLKILQDKKLQAGIHMKQQKAVKKYDVHTVGPSILNLYNEALLHRRSKMR